MNPNSDATKVVDEILNEMIDSLFEECAVCYEDICINEKLSCGHLVHIECIYKSKKTTCPLCRTELILTENQRSLIEKDEDEDEDEIFVELMYPPQYRNTYYSHIIELTIAQLELINAHEMIRLIH
jgi:hypothetical protein